MLAACWYFFYVFWYCCRIQPVVDQEVVHGPHGVVEQCEGKVGEDWEKNGDD